MKKKTVIAFEFPMYYENLTNIIKNYRAITPTRSEILSEKAIAPLYTRK